MCRNFMICYYKTLCRNHAFDDPKLLGKRQRKSKRSDLSQPSAVCRGCLPVRKHHRCDESKILPTTRLGIPLQDNLKKITVLHDLEYLLLYRLAIRNNNS